MEVVTLIIAVVALVMAVLAFVRSGGIHDVRRQVDVLASRTESATGSARDRTADLLDRIEHLIRGRERPPSEKEGESGGAATPGSPQ